jgi:hypothetical protein
MRSSISLAASDSVRVAHGVLFYVVAIRELAFVLVPGRWLRLGLSGWRAVQPFLCSYALWSSGAVGFDTSDQPCNGSDALGDLRIKLNALRRRQA